MGKVVSICIPTFKRAELLAECLARFIKQVESQSLQKKVDIVVFNDNAPDATTTLIKGLCKKYTYIRYVESTTRFGLKKAILHVASLAQAEYIWFFSDDDYPSEHAVKYVLSSISKHNPGIIFGNVDDFEEEKTIQTNVLQMNSPVFIQNRKEFFEFLNTKIFCLTYFISYISNFIIKKSLYDNYVKINDKYNSPYNMTPLITPFLYTNMECSILVTKEIIAKRRMGNESWVLNDKLKQLILTYKINSFHFENIQRINFRLIPIKLHLYLTFHSLKQYGFVLVAHLPYGLKILQIYFKLENYIYRKLFS